MHHRVEHREPEMLARAFPEFGEDRLRIATLGQFEEQAPDNPPFRHWVVTEAAERGDPCAAFAK